MFITLSDERMLEIWRQGAGLEPPLADASVEVFNSLDVTMRLSTAMRAWYLDYLADAPLDRVPISDVTESAVLTPDHADDQWIVRPKGKIARITSIECASHGSVPLINPLDPANAHLVRCLSNRFVRRGFMPVALYVPNAPTALILSASEPVISCVNAVIVTEDDTYIIDERILADIPSLASQAIASNF